MSLLTTVTVCASVQAEYLGDGQAEVLGERLSQIDEWLDAHRRQGHIIAVNEGPADWTYIYTGMDWIVEARFVDRQLAMLFKLTFGGSQ